MLPSARLYKNILCILAGDENTRMDEMDSGNTDFLVDGNTSDVGGR